jgi:molecular chaperone HtpG
MSKSVQDSSANTYKMRTSFDGLVKLLAKSLYPEPDVFIRELIQNGHDSIQLRQTTEPQFAGAIRIFSDTANRTIRFEDNGRGMDRDDIQELLAVIGRSGTGEERARLKAHDLAVETIGQFGIGLLSAFVVAERIDVYTRKVGTDQVWHWSNAGGEDYTLEPADSGKEGDREPGSTVIVTVAPAHLSHLDGEAIQKTVRKYADFLRFPIQVNGEGPVNAMHAPWHRGAAPIASSAPGRHLPDLLPRRGSPGPRPPRHRRR